MRIPHLADLHIESLHPHLLLLHDWPSAPPHIRLVQDRRPEAEIVEAARPAFVCCGHHHTASDFQLGPTRVLALSVISVKELIHRHGICPGWCVLFQWDGEGLQFLQAWP